MSDKLLELARAVVAFFDEKDKQKPGRKMAINLASLENRLIDNVEKKAILSRDEYELLCCSPVFVPTLDSLIPSHRKMCAYCNGSEWVKVHGIIDGIFCNGCGASKAAWLELVGTFEDVEIFLARGE